MRNKHKLNALVGGTVVMAIGAVFLISGCSELTSPEGKEVVVFVDFSDSVRGDNRLLFEQDLRKSILPSLEANDRVVVAPINDKTFTSFHPLVEVSFPPKREFNGWNDNLLNFNKEVKEVETEVAELKEGIGEKISNLFRNREASRQTDIFSSILMAQKLFDHAPRQKVLVLMSDMIVDYPPYRFDKIRWSAERNKEILSHLATKGLIPDLTGVCVYVSGVSAASADQASNIAQFWKDYFRLTNANMNSSRYAHVLLHWPPSKSCDA